MLFIDVWRVVALQEDTESLAFRLLEKARTATGVRTVMADMVNAYVNQYNLNKNRILYLHIVVRSTLTV